MTTGGVTGRGQDSPATYLGSRTVRSLPVYCADVGSVEKGRFGWARRHPQSDDSQLGNSITELVRAVADDLRSGALVALGFECPLFVPVRERPEEMTNGRRGEGNRPWSAAAGCAVLATGLTQVLWILMRLRELADISPSYLRWDQLPNDGPGLFLWEAFVSGDAKGTGDGNPHRQDAKLAVDAFLRALPDVNHQNAIDEPDVQSLVGAALLRSGWTNDVGILAQPCLVIRA